MKLKSFSDLAAHRDRFGVVQNDGPKKVGGQKVAVTKHATERLMDWRRAGKLSVKDAEKMLARAAVEGKRVESRPGGAYEVCWRGLYVLVCRDRDGTLAVLTFNGDREWRNWYRKTHVRLRYGKKIRAAL